ncbi:hypothetical protein PGB90_006460 [Kerria lacca]
MRHWIRRELYIFIDYSIVQIRRPEPRKKFLFNSTRLSKSYVLHSAPTVIKSKVVNFVIINLLENDWC